MPGKVYEPLANHALSVYPNLNAPGFDSSKVFALTALYIANPPPGFPSKGYLEKNLASVYVFVIHPTQRKGRETPKNPEIFYINITRHKVEVGRGKPPSVSSSFFSRKQHKVTVLECGDREFLDIATGKARIQPLIDEKKIRFKGKLDYFEKIFQILHHERSKLYKAVVTEPQKHANESSELEDSDDSLTFSHAPALRARL